MSTPKEQIVSALRSGEYKQTADGLRREDKFCVLGVICDVYMKDNPGIWEEVRVGWSSNTLQYPRSLTATADEGKSEYALQLLPPLIAEWAFGDRSQTNPEILTDKDADWTTLGHANDEDGFSFEELADIIEEQL